MGNTHRYTREDFRSAVAKETELPDCCAHLLGDIDDLLVYQADMKKYLFISVFFDIINMIFQGDPASRLQEVGIVIEKDAITSAENAPDLPDFIVGLNNITRGKVISVIQPHIVDRHSGACKKLRSTRKFWKKMLEAFS